MAENRVTATLSPADKQAVLDAIAAIKAKLPFLVDLTPEERHDLPKMGDKSQAFVRKALEIAAQNPDMLPRSFDLEEMRRDVALFEALQPLALALAQVKELLDDTLIAVSSEAYVAALAVYQYAKASGQGAALDELADALSRRFARQARPAPKP